MKHSFFLFAILVFTSACRTEIQGRFTASFPDLPAPEQGESWTSQNEGQAEGILREMAKAISKREANPNFTSRDAHPKAHGCPKAELTINNEKLPVQHRVGIFSQNANHKAWVRFSNGSPGGGADLDKDIRGMAVKLMNVPGSPRGSQDFVMINAREFFSKDGADYAALFKALLANRRLVGNALDLGAYAITHPLSAARFVPARIQVGSSLAISYHSSTIYKLGKTSMRFKMQPCSAVANIVPKTADKDFLRSDLSSSLSKGEACFDFMVQPNLRADKQPVEDPRVWWDEAFSPYIKVGQLRIYQQSNVATKQLRDFCENLSFDPWNTLPQTRPLGQINRMRSLIYREISRQRHQENQTTVMEPRSHTPCVDTSALCQDPHR
jgi:catalase